MRHTLLAIAIGTLMVGPASAHHSFAAYYFEEQSITLEGVVQELQYRSPHATLVFTTQSRDGRPQTYAAEWGSPNRLSSQGVTKDTLKPGDVVIVTGSPGRVASEYKIHLKGIHRPADGWAWKGRR